MNVKATVMLVDDNADVLDGFVKTQGKNYDVIVELCPTKALELVRRTPSLAAVVSDMRMPVMDGATFLGKVRQERPEAARLLLTGHAEAEAAARAVNEGRIFRFLTKPCGPEKMSEALADAVKMHQAITAERVLLHKTLVESVKVVISVLGLADPAAMGRAVRVRDRTRLLARHLAIEDQWKIECAALFSQLATVALPPEIAGKLEAGAALTAVDEREIVNSMQAITSALSEIPRLEPVTSTLTELIELTLRRQESVEYNVPETATDAELLRAIIELEALESRGLSPAQSIEEIKRRPNSFSLRTTAALETMIDDTRVNERMCALTALSNGMVLAEDLRTTDGLLLLPRGFELTRSSREHIVTRFKERLPERIKVQVDPIQQ